MLEKVSTQKTDYIMISSNRIAIERSGSMLKHFKANLSITKLGH
jgi:hypothetical protein